MDSGQETRLSAELEFYASHKAEWLQSHGGNYVVIKGSDTVGFFSSFEDAYRAGASKWGIDTDFLVKRIVEHEPVFVLF